MGTISNTGLDQGDLVSFITDAVSLCNELKDDIVQIKDTISDVLAKLDADGGVTDTDFVSLHATGGSATSVLPADVGSDDLSLTQ